LFRIAVNGDDISLGNKKNYTVKVLYDTSTVNIIVNAFDQTTKVTGSGNHKVKVGTNNIKLTITAEDGTKDIYNLKIIRSKPTAELSELHINEYSCGTEGNVLTIDMSNSTKRAVIQATAVDKSAKVTGSGTYNLNVGENKFYITVKAADGKSKKYTIIINRSKYKSVEIIIHWEIIIH
jgi:hypothetical protein